MKESIQSPRPVSRRALLLGSVTIVIGGLFAWRLMPKSSDSQSNREAPQAPLSHPTSQFELRALDAALAAATVIDDEHITAEQLKDLTDLTSSFFDLRYNHNSIDYENWSQAQGRSLNSRTVMSKWYKLGDLTQSVVGDRTGDTASSEELFPKLFAASIKVNNGASRPVSIGVGEEKPVIVIRRLSVSDPSYPSPPPPLADKDDAMLAGRRWFEPKESARSLMQTGASFPGASVAMKVYFADGSTCTAVLMAFWHPVKHKWMVDTLGFQKFQRDRITAVDY